MICGIDEAGRGPIVGPLVMAGVSVTEDKIETLKGMGIKDSKLIPPARREELFDEIIALVDSYDIIEISASEIDDYQDRGINLNQMEARVAAKIINKLKPSKVYVDSPEPANGGAKFGIMINEFLNVQPEMIAEHGADAKYVVAGAASILAKVSRDREVARIVEEIGAEIGSGYPHDPRCRAYLEENFRGPIHKYLRKCWSTYKRLNESQGQMNLSDF
ncbi:MAG: ribonuclease HII [Candidatus Nanoarchaeia archaeon]|jgi:ribonuclease HII|nr:ribonuclease HII [Candidatus Nanoarchaeia archaeon]|tara:strand:+ start:601 stop:1254 length:654 start_codon:yes stop_codon:yes gene_type:complete